MSAFLPFLLRFPVRPGIKRDLQGLLRERTDESGRRSPLEPFLGLQTWFWRITVEGRSRRLVWIVARIPREDGLPEYRRLEESR